MMYLSYWIKKTGYIWVLAKGGEVRKHFAVLDKITWQMIFYDIISIIRNQQYFIDDYIYMYYTVLW